MEKFKSMCGPAIAPTIMAALIFFLNYFCFGIENTMIAPFATLAFLRVRNMMDHRSSVAKYYLIFLAMMGLAVIASINLPLCIIVNALALFWLAYILIDEYDPTNYFPAGMALIFFQMEPVTSLGGLITRTFALTASMAIVFVFMVIIVARRPSKNPIADNIQLGLKNCQAQLLAYQDHDNTKLEVLHQELVIINKKICDEIYHYNRGMLRPTGKINWYCRYVVLFQVINYFTSQAYDKQEFQNISNILYCFSKQFEIRTPKADFKQLHFRNKKPSRQSFRFRFAMRILLVMTPCMAFAHISGLENSYWLVISVFFMMIPISDNTRERIKQRVLGTCLGIVICFVLFTIFPQFPGRVAIMMIANFMIYASTSYAMMVTYITCSALAIQSIDEAMSVVLLQRLIYTAIGALIAYLANKYIFQIRTRKEMVILIQRLDNLRSQLQQVSETSYPDPDERQHHTDELVIKSYMLMKRLQTYNRVLNPQDQVEAQDKDAFAIYEQKHMAFMAAYLKEHLLEKMPF